MGSAMLETAREEQLQHLLLGDVEKLEQATAAEADLVHKVRSL